MRFPPPEAGRYVYEIRYNNGNPQREARTVSLANDPLVRSIETPFSGWIEVLRYSESGVFVVATDFEPDGLCVWDPPIKFLWDDRDSRSSSTSQCAIQQGDSRTEFFREDRIHITSGGGGRRQEFSTTVRSELHAGGPRAGAPLGTETRFTGHQVWPSGSALAESGTMEIAWSGSGQPPSSHTLVWELSESAG